MIVLKKIFYFYIGPFLIGLFYKFLVRTWTIRLQEPDLLQHALKQKLPFILAHWHGDELALIHLAKRYQIATITSTSLDGELMDRVLKKLGAKTSRGSSTRGAVSALKGLIKLVRQGHRCSFAVDGPKGPLHQVKPGVFEMSKLTELPIYCAGITCDRAWKFHKSWNQTYLPKPFAKIVIFWEGPYPALTTNDNPRDLDRALQLKSLLHQAQSKAQWIEKEVHA